MIFTSKQVNEIIELLENLHWATIANSINPSHVPTNVLDSLKKAGFLKSQVLNYPELAFHFGMLSIYLNDSETKKLNFKQLKQAIRAKKFIPLSEEELNAVNICEMRAVQGIQGLGNRLSADMRTVFIEADLKQRSKYEKIIIEEGSKGIRYRKGVKGIVSDIGHRTGDWARDLDRMVDFFQHESYDTGRAYAIKRKFGSEALVYKRVHKDACNSCKKLYLVDLKTWEPKIFKVSFLIANGTNIKVKQSDWKPVLGATHPWCRCDLEHIPKGWIWDKKKKSFVPSKNLKHKDVIKRNITVEVS